MAEENEEQVDAPAGAEAAPSAASPAQPQEVLAPKERRQRSRAAKAARTRPGAPRTPEERHADRVAERRQKAELRRKERARAKAKAGAGGAAATTTPPREKSPGTQQTRQGIVVSDHAEKTIVVRIDIARRHRRYEKIVRTSRKLHVHDEGNEAHVGDTVIVRECRPLSRTKHWRLIEIVERAK